MLRGGVGRTVCLFQILPSSQWPQRNALTEYLESRLLCMGPIRSSPQIQHCQQSPLQNSYLTVRGSTLHGWIAIPPPSSLSLCLCSPSVNPFLSPSSVNSEGVMYSMCPCTVRRGREEGGRREGGGSEGKQPWVGGALTTYM